MTGDQVQALVNDDVNYVGRYLTGTVGVGANKMAKNLTRSGAQLIIQAGLHLVPIYQDNTGDVSDYTFNSGLHDGSAAVRAALALEIPDGHTIYFAVDTDMTEDENNDYAIPYFQSVAQAMESYQIGVYGTRNTCSMVSKAVSSVKYAYTSDMSTGYSGNLGFSQPLNWAFDQFDEVGPEGNLPGRDKVAVSHADEGVTNLVDSRVADDWIEKSDWKIMKQLMANHSVELNGNPYVLVDSDGLKVTVSYKNVSSLNSDSSLTFTYPIKNGRIDPSISTDFSGQGFVFGTNIVEMMNKFTAGLESGYVTINTELTKGSSYINHVAIEISDEKIKPQNATFNNQDVIVFDIEMNWVNTQAELVKNLKNPIDITMQKTSQAMLTLIQDDLSLNHQLAYGLMSAITSVLDDTNQLPSFTTNKNSIYSMIALIAIVLFAPEGL